MSDQKTVNIDQAITATQSGDIVYHHDVEINCEVLFKEPSDVKEKRLFCLIAEGDEDAFRHLFHQYTSLFSVIIKKIVHNQSVVEDLLQEVFMRIWLKRDMLNEVDKPRAWALQIVYHTSFNWLRHQNVYSKANGVANENGIGFSNVVEESISFTDTFKMLQRIIQKLPPQTQKIYRLNREQGLRIAEISQKMNLSPQTVKNTLGNAIKSIRKSLNQEGVIISVLYVLLLYFFS
ncbi:RNA polymerase sigma-70 factor [Arachidicoccus sp.]|uniref:RNA polymerase sigma-70 factor n=1 Tax=Arachidicoccus sp. TaxID=1872624 RepID=UPI003D1A91CA